MMAWKATAPGRNARPRRSRVDAVTVLSLYIAALLYLPSRLTVGPLGGAGSPAVILGLLALAWWLYEQARRTVPSGQGHQPVRTTLFIFLGCLAISYIFAMTRAIDPDESSTAQLGVVLILSWSGALLVANDGIVTREGFETLIRRLIFAGGALATLGIIQFFTGQLWVDRISLPPLLTYTQEIGGFTARGGFNRPPGTAIHPIEFGAIITMILPLALNMALSDRLVRSALRRWYPVAAILFAVATSSSRSALICAAISVIGVALAWTPAARRAAVLVGVLFGPLVFLTVPGMLGTFAGMFAGISNDGSALSRVGSYTLAGEFISRSPWFGRGYSTFLPKYRILDNQYLGLLIEIGFVGLAAFLALLLTAIVCARSSRSVATDATTQQLGQALAASIASGSVGLAFYDGLGFPTAAATLFLVVGLAGCSWKLARNDHDARHGTEFAHV